MLVSRLHLGPWFNSISPLITDYVVHLAVGRAVTIVMLFAHGHCSFCRSVESQASATLESAGNLAIVNFFSSDSLGG